MLPKKLSSVFLDFDGVVIESANIKTLAFHELYLPYGSDIADKAMNYHIKHQGVSRYKKFIEIHRMFLNKTCSEDEKEKLSKKFSEIVLEKILDCPFVTGILDFLMQLRNKKIPVFLLSATPHDELITICKKRKIFDYFKDIYGAPYEKNSVGINIVQKHNLNKGESIFIGDSPSDFKAAKTMNITFIGRVPRGEINPFDASTPIIENFKDLF